MANFEELKAIIANFTGNGFYWRAISYQEKVITAKTSLFLHLWFLKF